MLNGRRLLVFSLALTSAAFGACNCDEELYAFPGDLVGVVCAADSGQSVAGVPITVLDASGDTIEAVTDGSGIFRAENVSAGDATVTIHAPDGERQVSVEIVAGKEARFDDELCGAPVPPANPVGTLEGCACDDAVGAWVESANVFVITALGAVHTTATDAVGCYSLADVPAGPQILEISKGAFYQRHEVEVPSGGVLAVPSPATCEPAVFEGEVGTVVGRVCAPDGVTWLADATVSVTRADGSVTQDVTDADGNYTLESVPVGDQAVTVTKGSFTSSFDVVVVANQTTTVPEDECQLEAPDVKIAVVTGSYDRVQDVLSGIGVEADNVTTYPGVLGSFWVTSLLEDYETLSQYDIVFLNCGVSDTAFGGGFGGVNQVALANLRQFVTEGGSVYASDWAYTIVERAWPESVDFQGDDDTFGVAKVGAEAAAIIGTIIDQPLASAMATSSIELHYPLGAWVPMTDVAGGVTVYIRGDAPLIGGGMLVNVPHTVGFNSGAGRVIYTSFHQEPGISAAQERVLQLLMFEL